MNCPNCGMEIEGDKKVCPLCGFIFEESMPEADEPVTESVSETVSSPEHEKAKKSKEIVVAVILILIVAALGTVTAIKFLGGSGHNNVNTVRPVSEVQTETQTQATETTATTSVSETTVTTVTTTIQTTKETAESVAETTSKKEQATEAVKVSSDDEVYSTYNGGIEYPRIYAFVRQKGNEFIIRIRWSSGATSCLEYISGGTLDGGSYWDGDMSVCTVEYEDDNVYCEVYSIEEHTLRFYPENGMIMWDDIVLTKESDGAEFVIGTVKIKEGVLNVRSNTNTQSQIIGTLDKGDIVPIVEDLGDWYLILYNNSIGAVSSEFIEVN